MTPRQRWKIQYRLKRIMIREMNKCLFDTLLYGTGAIFVDGTEPKHVPANEIYNA